jgi:hypothetical protein
MNLPNKLQYYLPEEAIYFISIGPTGAFMAETNPKKPTGGTGEFSLSINVAFSDVTYKQNFALCRATKGDIDKEYPCNPQEPDVINKPKQMNNTI